MLMLSFTVNGDLGSWRSSAPVTHWLQEFFEESNIPSHELGGRVSWIKVNAVGFRRFLGSNGMSIWRSGYLLWKLIPLAANTKMLPLTASLLWALIQGRYTLTVISSVHARAQFSLQVQFWSAPFCFAGYVFAKMCSVLTDCPVLSLSLCFPLWTLPKGDLQAWKLWFETFPGSVYLCSLKYQILAPR